MSKHFFSFILMTVFFAAVFASCDKEVTTGEDPTVQVNVNLRADINPISTYVANDQWETNDKVGLYMKRTGQPLTAIGAVYNDAVNVQMSLVGQTLTSTPPVMYPISGNVDFVAYYPYTASVNPDFTIPVNVAGQAAGLPVEILYSNNVTNQLPTASAVTLNFKYSLAKIELTVTGGANASLTAADFAAATASVESLYTQAKFQLAGGTFTNHQGKQPVTLHRKSANATSATFEALVLPTSEEITFLFNVGGDVYRHKITVNYASETLYKYNFALDFPYFPEKMATLLNAVIIPRGETPQQNITIDASKQITMTTAASSVSLGIKGTGKITIDWGDGTPNETYTLGAYTSSNTHNYSSPSARTITITGENVTYLDCSNNQLTSLNVSNNTALTELGCQYNQLTGGKLNELFESLPTVVSGIIIIQGNPGISTCDFQIAYNKGWGQAILPEETYITVKVNPIDWIAVEPANEVNAHSAVYQYAEHKIAVAQDAVSTRTKVKVNPIDGVRGEQDYGSTSYTLPATDAEKAIKDVAVYVYKMDVAHNIFPESYAYIPDYSVSYSASEGISMKATDGTKKIFVAVNTGSVSNNFVDISQGATPSDEGRNYSGLFSALNKTLYTAVNGWDTSPSSNSSTSANGLIKSLAGGAFNFNNGVISSHGLSSGFDKYFLMSNWDNATGIERDGGAIRYTSDCVFTVTNNIDRNSSKQPGNPNYFTINVQRAVAKATLKITAPKHTDNISYISDGNDGDKGIFTLWKAISTTEPGIFAAGNISKVATVFQKYTNNSVSDANYSYIPVTTEAWYQNFDNTRVFGIGKNLGSIKINEVKDIMETGYNTANANSHLIGKDTLYLTENAQESIAGYMENSTYLVVGGEYKPRRWISNIIQSPVTTNPPITGYNGATLFGTEPSGSSVYGVDYVPIPYSNLPVPSNDTLYYHVGKKLFFYGKINLFRYYAWVDKKDTDTPGTLSVPVAGEYGPGTALNPEASVAVMAAINADMANGVLVRYFKGNCFYRVFITDYDAAKSNERVLVRRNHLYNITISKIFGPGIEQPFRIVDGSNPITPP